MMSPNKRTPSAVLGLLLLVSGAGWAIGGCNSSDDGNAKPTVTGGTSSTATGGSTSTGATPGAGGTTGTGAVGGGAGAVPGNCTDAADRNCYSCTPQTRVQFLNQCPTFGCEPFDNVARLPRYSPTEPHLPSL